MDVRQICITKGQALELFLKYKSGNLSDVELVKCFSEMSNLNSENINLKALIAKLYRTNNDLKSKRGRYRDIFLSENFTVPVCTAVITELPEKELIEEGNVEVGSIEKNICETETVSKLEERRTMVKSLREKNKQLTRKLERVKRKIDTAAEKSDDLKRLKKDNFGIIKENEKLMKKNRNLFNQLKNVKSCGKTLRNRVVALRKQKDRISYQLNETAKHCTELKTQNENLVKENKQLKSEAVDLNQNCDYLSQLLNDDSVIELYDNVSNAYSTKTMECVMNLSNCNVAHHNIPKVMEIVLSLAGKTPNRLPKRSTIDNIISAKAVLTQKQLSSVLPSKQNLTLYTDETRKFGQTYNTYIVTDEQQSPYFLGLREMYNKAAQTAFDTLQTIMHDLNESYVDPDNNVGDKIISNIVNTMSDRASTEKAFNGILESYRKTVLPTVTRDWMDFNDHQKEALGKMNSFFCGLHLLVAFAEVSDKCLMEYEELVKVDINDGDKDEEETNESVKTQSESSTIQLIRASSKCLSRGGDEKSGCFMDFNTYLSTISKKVKFVRFHGNRFNIIFLLAEVLYYHRDDITSFFESKHLPSNRLQKAVLSGVKKDILMAGCKVLGFISKLITAPLWRILENGVHVLEMNEYYLKLVNYLQKVSDDPSLFLSGEEYAFEEFYVHKDDVFTSLTNPNEQVDTFAEQISKTVATALQSLIKRMVSEHLPGGKYENFSEDFRKKTASVIPHNKLPEFVFGVLDFQLRYRPNATTLVNESFLMYSMNKTREWLDKLSDEEKNKLISDCRKEGRKYRETFKARCKEIHEHRKRILEEKAKEAEKSEKKARQKKEEIVSNILYDGLWQSEESIDEALGIIKSNKEKRDSLIWQLKFRKTILQQSYSDKSVYKFSKKVSDSGNKYVNLTIEELRENLLKLIQDSLKGPTIEKKRVNTPLLVGKKIEHKFGDGEIYSGRVVSVVPGYPDWYNVVYDNDQAVYSYKLHEDYKNSDLKIIPERPEVFLSTVNQFKFSHACKQFYSYDSLRALKHRKYCEIILVSYYSSSFRLTVKLIDNYGLNENKVIPDIQSSCLYLCVMECLWESFV